MNNTWSFSRLLLVGLFVMVLAGCAAGPNTAALTTASDGSIAGFWLGFWHGMIVPITFIISLFSDSVSIYEIHNSGVWYNLGFVFGLGGFFGGSTSCGRKHYD